MAGGHPPAKPEIAGVVLAGGLSSRMGQDKAVLPFHGRPLIDHMIDLLHASGCKDVFVGGQRAGYQCIPDRAPNQGPAVAMRDVLRELGAYQGVLFVPVDMPLLTPDFLRQLLTHEKGAFFEGWPLPSYIASSPVRSSATSVQAFLAEMGILPVRCPADAEKFLVNLNTPDEWKRVVRK